jgi:hypothetical protein
MRFISKTQDPLSFSRESILNLETGEFCTFIGGHFDTEDEKAIAFLKAKGYKAIEEPRSEPKPEPETKKEKVKK